MPILGSVPTKYPAGSFVELDDLMFGRKIALVCDDGLTSQDSIDIDKISPLAIHVIQNPESLGFLNEYVSRFELNDEINLLINTMTRLDLTDELRDPLLIMRVLSLIVSDKKAGIILGEPKIKAYIKAAKNNQNKLNLFHQNVAKFIHSCKDNKLI
ncbi:hypothetical protein [Yersinia pseudotuberculosis]|uniref:hypothetical protein n=1 Tax=Yersinia pseudotuberculosis TaxID=633 RepID=UPI0005E204E5|nr:hypothetical protein [Yersinia pseudotuberculosis]CND61833.1 Uncharacterised protein [Yersinia pseudotuberculosis]